MCKGITVSAAKKLAADWIEKQTEIRHALKGAYLSGSVLTMEPSEILPASSDVDVVLVFKRGMQPPVWGKTEVQGVVLEITCMSEDVFTPLSRVLTTHYLAYALGKGQILLDDEGFLSKIHEETVNLFGKKEWVLARCRSFYDQISSGIEKAGKCENLPQEITNWAFSTGITCFPILTVALENCTVRKRYPAARQVLQRQGMQAFYEDLLRQLAPVRLSASVLSAHLAHLEETFWLACRCTGGSAQYAFRKDISPWGATSALEGSRELIESDEPMDAVFWMVATFARCHTIFLLDDPKLHEKRLPALWQFLGDLGLFSLADIVERTQKLDMFLPKVKETAEKLLS